MSTTLKEYSYCGLYSSLLTLFIKLSLKYKRIFEKNLAMQAELENTMRDNKMLLSAIKEAVEDKKAKKWAKSLEIFYENDVILNKVPQFYKKKDKNKKKHN